MRAFTQVNFPSFFAALLIFSLTAVSCGKTKVLKKADAVTQAYAMMDQGENARAILVLEDELVKNPANVEARLMLASAHVGKAGIDIYKVHDGFRDLIFNKPLKEMISSAGPATAAPSKETTEKSDEKKESDAVVERLVKRLDELLGKIKVATAIMDRFPAVKETDWPLLDHALDILDPIPSRAGQIDRDIAAYRLLIRVIYLNAYLSVRVIRNGELGQISWACDITLDSIEESLRWILSHVGKMLADYERAFPNKPFALTGVKVGTEAVAEALQQMHEHAPAGEATATLVVEEKIKKALQCESN